jgi:MFS superfamily sulfate permease-like transporter
MGGSRNLAVGAYHLLYSLLDDTKMNSNTCTGPDAVVAALVGAIALSEYNANPDPSYSAGTIASLLAFMVGCLGIILSLLNAGFVDHILSGYLLTGFILGVSNAIMVDQIPELLGLELRLNQAVVIRTLFYFQLQLYSKLMYHVLILRTQPSPN